jgi:hypothetical protein
VLRNSHEAIVSVVIDRLSELIAEIDGDFERTQELFQEFKQFEFDSDKLRRRIDEAVLSASFLYEDMAIAKGYFDQVCLGPDAEALLKQIGDLQQDIPEYGNFVASILFKEFELLSESNLFVLKWEVLVESYCQLRTKFETICAEVTKSQTESLASAPDDGEYRAARSIIEETRNGGKPNVGLANESTERRLNSDIGTANLDVSQPAEQDDQLTSVGDTTLKTDGLKAPPPCHVTLLQMAGIVNREKRTLERLRKEQRLPSPAVRGGGGKPNEWRWPDVRPILEAEYGRPLPEVFPADRFVR